MANNFPALRPSLNLDFVGMGVLDPRVTFTRASASGGYYDGKTFVKAEENLFVRSQEFDSVLWTGGGVGTKPGVVANDAVAPDGTLTADRLLFDTQFKAIGQANLTSVGVTFAYSIWLRVATGTRSLSFANGSGTILETFVVTDTWQRFSYVGTSASGAIALQDRNASGFVDVFAWGAQLEIRGSVTAYTPTTTQPITRYQPKLLTVAATQPVFDHNPVTGAPLGLRAEEARTNLLTYSEQFDNAAWSKTNSAVTSNQIIAPDGTLTADKLVGNATLNGHNVQRGISLTSGVSYTFSVCAKKAGTRYLVLRFVAGGAFSTNYIVSFDLDNGTATNNVSFPATSFKVEGVGNGFYRCSITQAASTSAVGTVAAFLSDNGSDTTYLDDGFSGIYIWGAQLEAGAFATSYIKTEASQVTRAADSAVMTGVNFSSWYRQDEGAFVFGAADAVVGNSTNNRHTLLETSNNTADNAIRLGKSVGGANADQVYTNIVAGGTEQAYFAPTGTIAANTFYKYGMSYKVNDIAASLSGGTIGSDTVSLIPAADRLTIGSRVAGTNPFSGYIKRITYYPKRLTNAELQAVTR